MSNLICKFGRLGILAAVCFALAAAGFGQLSLRDAMDGDGDGKADYSIFRPENNAWYVNSAGGISIQVFGISNTDYPSPGDFDGDGKGDIAVWRDTDGVWYWLNSSDSTFNAVAFGMAGDEPVGRDYDGDGTTDPAVVRRTDGNMIWYVLGSTDGFISQQFGLSTDYTAPGDYDGDGKFDYAIQRPGETATSQATFFIQRSSDNGFTVVPWGLSNDLVVPGDYDGDGMTDLAVLREGETPTDNLVWYIQRSSDLGLIALTFGITGDDLNAQNDYDGDGKTDISIWRNSEGRFYVMRSSDSVLSVTQWGQGNDYPVASYDTH